MQIEFVPLTHFRYVGTIFPTFSQLAEERNRVHIILISQTFRAPGREAAIYKGVC